MGLFSVGACLLTGFLKSFSVTAKTSTSGQSLDQLSTASCWMNVGALQRLRYGINTQLNPVKSLCQE